METVILERVFIYKENGVEIRLTDIEGFSPEAVQNFYSATYPLLNNARIVGPEIKNDEQQYRFETTMGTKG
jgi:PRTRC genetic system protein C